MAAGQARAIVCKRRDVKRRLRSGGRKGMEPVMPDAANKPTREERLAAKLRENLHRRKARTRAVEAGASNGDQGDGHKSSDKNESATLPKPPPES